MSAEFLNQYTTILGWSHGFKENDPTGRYLLSIGPLTEIAASLLLAVFILSTASYFGLRFKPKGRRGTKLQAILTPISIVLAVLLGISCLFAAISDLQTLHGFGVV